MRIQKGLTGKTLMFLCGVVFSLHHVCLALDFSGLGPTSMSSCLPITPSSTESGSAALSALHQGIVGAQTPSTPELYAALDLSYNRRLVEAQSSGRCL